MKPHHVKKHWCSANLWTGIFLQIVDWSGGKEAQRTAEGQHHSQITTSRPLHVKICYASSPILSFPPGLRRIVALPSWRLTSSLPLLLDIPCQLPPLPESFIFPSLPATSHPANMTKVAIWAPTICQVHDDLSALSWLILAPTQQSMRYLLHLEMRKLRLQGILCYSFPSSSNCKVTKLGLTSGSSASSTQNLTSTQAVNNSPPLPSQIPLKKFLFMCLLPHLSFTPQPAAVCFLHLPSAEIAPLPFQGHQRRNGQSQ